MGRQHNRCRWCIGHFHWDWLDMRKLLKTYQNAEPDSPDSISSSSSSSPELHVPQPKRQKKQPASTTTKPQKPNAKVIGWVDGITSQAPPEDPYEFRSITPSPELQAYLQPPACTPPSSHSPPSPSPPPDSTTQKSTSQHYTSTREKSQHSHWKISYTGTHFDKTCKAEWTSYSPGSRTTRQAASNSQ